MPVGRSIKRRDTTATAGLEGDGWRIRFLNANRTDPELTTLERPGRQHHDRLRARARRGAAAQSSEGGYTKDRTASSKGRLRRSHHITNPSAFNRLTPGRLHGRGSS